MKFVLLVLFFSTVYCDHLDNEVSEKGTERDEIESNEGNRVLGDIFQDAVQNYLEENWRGCIEGFNEALHGYKTYRRMVINCRRKCKGEAADAAPIFPENIEDLHFYEKKVVETLCLLQCNQDYREIAGAKALTRLPREVERKFVEGRVYEYLHICYYKVNRYQDATNAVFTFLVHHTKHEASLTNLKYYLTLPDVSEDKIQNLEAPPFVELYFKGVTAYEEKDYADAVIFFENSLKLYMRSEEECRLYCEGPFDQGWLPEFTSSIANHFAYCLKCKRSCSQWLNNVNGDYRSDLLRNHYNYLQFAYYKLGEIKAACAAVSSYLLFAPTDNIMLYNKDYYSGQPKFKKSYFTPRKEAVLYTKRQEYELKILKFISDEFSAIDTRLSNFNKKNKSKASGLEDANEENELEQGNFLLLHPPPGRSPTSQIRLASNLSTIRDGEKKILKGHQVTKQLDVQLIAEGKELGGRYRYVADGFLNSTECNLLMMLAHVATVEGDGYEKDKNPHSVYEKFEGVTIGRAALMVYFGRIQPELLEIFLQGTETARTNVERYFNLDRQLYFTYTHLVCRTALPDSPLDRDDLSHEIHADNCVITDKGCFREDPAYGWRDYSAILYLNDDFEGGEFFFAQDHKNRQAKSTVQPRCGRMVAFSAGEENFHGVRGVLQGKRCALALWFTQDEDHIEYERILAEVILKRVRLSGIVERDDFEIPLRYEDVLIESFKQDKLLTRLLKNSRKSL